jgi:hypothetical protein
MGQHDMLIRSLEKVAGDEEGDDGGWKIKLIIFVEAGTSGWCMSRPSMTTKELQVIESKRNAIRKGLVIKC